MNFYEILRKANSQNWVEVTKKFLIHGKYRKNDFLTRNTFEQIDLPYYINFNSLDDDVDELNKTLHKSECNLIYLQTIAADRDLLVDYVIMVSKHDGVNSDVAAYKEAIYVLEEYTEFLKRHFKSEQYQNIFNKEKKFNFNIAITIWDLKYKPLRSKIFEINRKSKNKKNVRLMDE